MNARKVAKCRELLEKDWFEYAVFRKRMRRNVWYRRCHIMQWVNFVCVLLNFIAIFLPFIFGIIFFVLWVITAIYWGYCIHKM